MPMYTTTPGASALLPETIHRLLVLPTLAQSIAAQVATVVNVSTKTFRVPRVLTDPTASFVFEGSEIAPSDAVLDEVIVTPAKAAGLTILSRELAEDSSPEAAAVVGEGLARDISKRVDAAFFGDLAAPAPAGLGSLVGFTDGGTAATGADVLDALLEATYTAETVGANLNVFVTSPETASSLATVKMAAGSVVNVLSPDPKLPTQRMVAGIPMLVSAAVEPGVVWGIDTSRTYLVVRDDATIETDRSVFFTSDRVAVKATMRVGFAFAHAASVIKITAS